MINLIKILTLFYNINANSILYLMLFYNIEKPKITAIFNFQ